MSTAQSARAKALAAARAQFSIVAPVGLVPNSFIKTMSSIVIAELAGKNHADVMRDIRNMLSELKIDQSSFAAIYFDAYNREQPCFNLPHDESICLMAGYSATARMAIIKRWQELEGIVSAPVAAIKTPESFAAALRLAADQQDTIAAQALQIAIAAPAVAFVDSYVDATGLKGFRQVCKLLGANEHAFRDFLIDEKIMYRLNGEWVPYAPHLDAGRIEVKAGKSDHNGHAFNSARWTPKGVSWIAGEWAKFNVRCT